MHIVIYYMYIVYVPSIDLSLPRYTICCFFIPLTPDITDVLTLLLLLLNPEGWKQFSHYTCQTNQP